MSASPINKRPANVKIDGSVMLSTAQSSLKPRRWVNHLEPCADLKMINVTGVKAKDETRLLHAAVALYHLYHLNHPRVQGTPTPPPPPPPRTDTVLPLPGSPVMYISSSEISRMSLCRLRLKLLQTKTHSTSVQFRHGPTPQLSKDRGLLRWYQIVPTPVCDIASIWFHLRRAPDSHPLFPSRHRAVPDLSHCGTIPPLLG